MTIGIHDFWTFLLAFSRVTALFVSAPILGNRAVPARVKIGLSALIAFALMPLIGGSVKEAPNNLFSLIGQIAAETAVGLLLGLMVTLLFAALDVAGHYIDTQMGLSIINILNPLTQQQTSAVGQLLTQLGMTLFLIFGGHLALIKTLALSYLACGPGAAHFQGDVSGVITTLIGQMFLLALRIAAPAAVILLVVDVAFGLVARSVPQMNVFIVGLPVKVLIGLTTVAMILPVLAMMVAQMIPGLEQAATPLMKALR